MEEHAHTGTAIYDGPAPPRAELIVDAIETIQGVRYAEKTQMQLRISELEHEVQMLRVANEQLAKQIQEAHDDNGQTTPGPQPPTDATTRGGR